MSDTEMALMPIVPSTSNSDAKIEHCLPTTVDVKVPVKQGPAGDVSQPTTVVQAQLTLTLDSSGICTGLCVASPVNVSYQVRYAEGVVRWVTANEESVAPVGLHLSVEQDPIEQVEKKTDSTSSTKSVCSYINMQVFWGLAFIFAVVALVSAITAGNLSASGARSWRITIGMMGGCFLAFACAIATAIWLYYGFKQVPIGTLRLVDGALGLLLLLIDAGVYSILTAVGLEQNTSGMWVVGIVMTLLPMLQLQVLNAVDRWAHTRKTAAAQPIKFLLSGVSIVAGAHAIIFISAEIWNDYDLTTRFVLLLLMNLSVLISFLFLPSNRPDVMALVASIAALLSPFHLLLGFHSRDWFGLSFLPVLVAVAIYIGLEVKRRVALSEDSAPVLLPEWVTSIALVTYVAVTLATKAAAFPTGDNVNPIMLGEELLLIATVIFCLGCAWLQKTYRTTEMGFPALLALTVASFMVRIQYMFLALPVIVLAAMYQSKLKQCIVYGVLLMWPILSSYLLWDSRAAWWFMLATSCVWLVVAGALYKILAAQKIVSLQGRQILVYSAGFLLLSMSMMSKRNKFGLVPEFRVFCIVWQLVCTAGSLLGAGAVLLPFVQKNTGAVNLDEAPLKMTWKIACEYFFLAGSAFVGIVTNPLIGPAYVVDKNQIGFVDLFPYSIIPYVVLVLSLAYICIAVTMSKTIVTAPFAQSYIVFVVFSGAAFVGLYGAYDPSRVHVYGIWLMILGLLQWVWTFFTRDAVAMKYVRSIAITAVLLFWAGAAVCYNKTNAASWFGAVILVLVICLAEVARASFATGAEPVLVLPKPVYVILFLAAPLLLIPTWVGDSAWNLTDEADIVLHIVYLLYFELLFWYRKEWLDVLKPHVVSEATYLFLRDLIRVYLLYFLSRFEVWVGLTLVMLQIVYLFVARIPLLLPTAVTVESTSSASPTFWRRFAGPKLSVWTAILPLCACLVLWSYVAQSTHKAISKYTYVVFTALILYNVVLVVISSVNRNVLITKVNNVLGKFTLTANEDMPEDTLIRNFIQLRIPAVLVQIVHMIFFLATVTGSDVPADIEAFLYVAIWLQAGLMMYYGFVVQSVGIRILALVCLMVGTFTTENDLSRGLGVFSTVSSALVVLYVLVELLLGCSRKKFGSLASSQEEQPVIALMSQADTKQGIDQSVVEHITVHG